MQKQINSFDWSDWDDRPTQHVKCRAGHDFVSHTRFDGYLVSVISRIPCPVCGETDIVSAYGLIKQEVK